MKRLTNRTPDGIAYVSLETENEGVWEFTTQRSLLETISRLADIEDILGNDYDLERFRDIMQAVALIGNFVYEKIQRGYVSKYEVTSVRVIDTSVTAMVRIIDGYVTMAGFNISEIGKTVFLNYKDAECAGG